MWLGDEDSNLDKKNQNLRCCQLHHPRRSLHGSDRRDKTSPPAGDLTIEVGALPDVDTQTADVLLGRQSAYGPSHVLLQGCSLQVRRGYADHVGPDATICDRDIPGNRS